MKKTICLLLACVMLFSMFSTAYAYATVQNGSRGEDVKTLQKMLNAVTSANLSVDGIFGPATLNAVKAYQKSEGLDADGICGPKTWAALEADYNALQNVASTLKVNLTTYPTTINEGDSFGLRGTITSNYVITRVDGSIVNSSGRTVDSASDTPNATTLDIRPANVNQKLEFGKLAAGQYTLKISATDKSGKTVEVVKSFTVKGKESTLKIGSGKYSPGTLARGNSYSISGTISSNYNITSVSVGVYDSNGNPTAQVKTVSPNKTSYDINGVDSYIKFGQLEGSSSGTTYYFKVVATDASGMTKTLVNNSFVVKSPTQDNSTGDSSNTEEDTVKTCSKHTYKSASGNSCTVCGYEYVPALTAVNKTMYATKDEVAVRNEPYADSGAISRKLSEGDSVEVAYSLYNSVGSLWYRTSDGKYIYSDNLTVNAPVDNSSCETHKYTSAGGDICTVCGYKFVPTLVAESASYYARVNDTESRMSYYSSAGPAQCFAKGTRIDVTHRLVNSLGETWYKTDAGYFIESSYVTLEQQPDDNGCETHSYTSASGDICTICGYEYVPVLIECRKTMYTRINNVAVREKPYAEAGVRVGLLDKGAEVTVTHYFFNSMGSKWYLTQDGKYIYSERLSDENPQTGKDTLLIGRGKYNPGALNYLDSYSISGIIVSEEAKLKAVTVGVYNPDGTHTEQMKTDYPDAYRYNINSADGSIHFGELEPGDYIFRVTATDRNGATAVLVNNRFTVNGRKIESLQDAEYREMAEAVHELQGGKMCVLTSYAMLLKSKLYLEGDSYYTVNQNVVMKEYNNNQVNANWGGICDKINKKLNLEHTCTTKSIAGKAAEVKKEIIISLLERCPEGIVVYYYYNGNNQHAVRFCNYDKNSDTFYVSDPGNSNMKYVALEDSLIGNGKYAWRSAEKSFEYANRIIFFQ